MVQLMVWKVSNQGLTSGARRREIRHIRSAVHSPIKREVVFCKDINEFRRRYNHFRPHTSLKNKTPDEIYNDFNKLF